MPNYSLVIDSKFKPFSYAELLAPVQQATQAHQEVENAYADLAAKANVWDQMANEETDPIAHQTYKSYAEDLKAKADRLARYGLDITSRRALLDMRSRYSREIVPIEQAYQKRAEQAKQQAEILAKDPTRFFAQRAAETSLDRFLENPALDTISQNYSGALLTKQVSDAASALARDARNDPNVQTELKKLLPYQYEAIRRTGFDPEAIRQAILNSPDADKILTSIVDTAMTNSGMGDWNYASPQEKQRILNQAREYANQGLWSAVGQTQYQMVTDEAGLAAYRQNLQLRAQQSLMAQQAADRMRMYDIDPTNYFSADEIAEEGNRITRELDSWQKKGYFDAQGNLTSKGKEALHFTKTQVGTSRTRDPNGEYQEVPRYKTTGDAKFYQWATATGKITDAHIKQGAYTDLQNYVKDTRSALATGKIPTGTANFQVYRQFLGSSDDRNHVADKMLNALAKGVPIIEAGKLNKDHSIATGKRVSMDEFIKQLGRDENGTGTSRIVYVTNSPTTGVQGEQLIELSNGKKYIIPAGVLGNDAVANLAAANLRIRGAASPAETATNLNLANATLASILTTVGGTEIKPNDGTVTFDISGF